MKPNEQERLQQAIVGYAIVEPSALSRYEALGFDRTALPDSYQAVLAALDRGTPFEELPKTLAPAAIRQLGGISGLARLIDPEVATESLAYWGVQALTEGSKRAALLSRLTEIYKEVDRGGSLAAGGVALATLGAEATPNLRTQPRGAQELTEAFFDRLEAEREPLPIRIGVPECDRYLSNLVGGELVVLGARPATGKTSWATQLVIETAKAGIGSLTLTAEMGCDELWARIMSQESRVNGMKVRFPKLVTSAERQAFLSAADRLTRLPLHLLEVGPRSIEEICAITRREVEAKGLKLVVVDYLQLLNGTGNRQSRYEEVSGISRRLKQLAVQTKTVVLALAQLNRPAKEQESKLPTMSSLRDSGQIEQDADMIFLFSRGAQALSTTVQVAKNRHGPTGEFSLLFEPQCTRFVEGGEIERESKASEYDEEAGF